MRPARHQLRFRRVGREDVVIPGNYKHIHGGIVINDPKTLILPQMLKPFDHYSNIPTFHFSILVVYKRTALKDSLCQ